MEKQNVIIDAALAVFGRNGYKKASVRDIAMAAGISKAMVFHYFGSKEKLYSYLLELCGNILFEEIEHNLDETVSDFFDKLKMVTKIKIAVMKRFPNIRSFLLGAYYETNDIAKTAIGKIRTASLKFADILLFDNADNSKFKEGVDAKVVFKFMILASEGFANKLSPEMLEDFDDNVDEFMEDFYNCLDMMKKNFYKDEFLPPEAEPAS